MHPSRIVYFEIPATEPKACMDFYQAVLGWEFRQMEDKEYWLTKTGSDDLPGINGAITLKPRVAETVINTIHVQDLEETMAAITEHGGEIISSKTSLKGIGWLIYFMDPEGNAHGALQTDHLA